MSNLRGPADSLEDSLKPFRDFADAVIDMFRKERTQDDYTLTNDTWTDCE